MFEKGGTESVCIGGGVCDFQQVSPRLVPCQPEGRRKRLAGLGQALGKCALEKVSEEPQKNAPATSFVKVTGTCWGHSRVCGFLLEI